MFITEMNNAKNQKVMRKYDKILESCRHKKSKRTLVWARIIAESILIGWSGVIDENGSPVEATTDNKIAALIKYDRLFLDVMEASQDTQRFRPDEIDDDDDDDDAEHPDDPKEDTSENLDSTSDGISNTVVSWGFSKI